MQPLLNQQGAAAPSIHDIVHALRNMNHVMHQESACIKSSDFRALQSLQELKQKSVVVLVHLRRYLQAHENFLSDQPEDVKKELLALNREFESIAQENFSLINDITRSNKALLTLAQKNKVKDAVQRTGYNAQGSFGNFSQQNPHVDTWLTLNDKI